MFIAVAFKMGLTILLSRCHVSLLEPTLLDRVTRIEFCGTQELSKCEFGFAELAHLQ